MTAIIVLNSFVDDMEIEINRNQLRINYKAREWCLLPYPDHPKGWPNFGRHQTCPPTAPLVENFIDLQKQLYLIIVEFDLGLHIRKMIQKHQGWSERQAKCVLYWQSGVNAQLESECNLFRWSHLGVVTTRCPEAMGVNVIATAGLVGLPIKVKPSDTVYKIALAGKPLTKNMVRIN